MINRYKILNGQKYFYSEIFQNYLVFVPAKKHMKYFSGTTRISLPKFNEMSEENTENVTKTDSSFALTFHDHHLLPEISFNGHCYINNNNSFYP